MCPHPSSESSLTAARHCHFSVGCWRAAVLSFYTPETSHCTFVVLSLLINRLEGILDFFFFTPNLECHFFLAWIYALKLLPQCQWGVSPSYHLRHPCFSIFFLIVGYLHGRSWWSLRFLQPVVFAAVARLSPLCCKTADHDLKIRTPKRPEELQLLVSE